MHFNVTEAKPCVIVKRTQTLCYKLYTLGSTDLLNKEPSAASLF